MSSTTPSRPGSPPWLAIAGVGAIVAAVVVVALLWLLIGGGYLAAFGSWMHTSDAGSGLRYVLEGLLLLVCLLLSTAVLIYRRAKDLGLGASAPRPERRRPVGRSFSPSRTP